MRLQAKAQRSTTASKFATAVRGCGRVPVAMADRESGSPQGVAHPHRRQFAGAIRQRSNPTRPAKTRNVTCLLVPGKGIIGSKRHRRRTIGVGPPASISVLVAGTTARARDRRTAPARYQRAASRGPSSCWWGRAACSRAGKPSGSCFVSAVARHRGARLEEESMRSNAPGQQPRVD